MPWDRWRYLLTDDTHFYYAGLDEEDMFGYYLTMKVPYDLKSQAKSKMMLWFGVKFNLTLLSKEGIEAHTWQRRPT